MASLFLDGRELQDKRCRILQLHVDELKKQATTRNAELSKALEKLKALEKTKTITQPQERKLFARLEQQQAELKLAKEHQATAEKNASELTARLEQLVEAARVESETPGQKMLLQVTTAQLEMTQTALAQAMAQAASAEQQQQRVEAEKAEMQRAAAAAAEREADLAKRLDSLLQRSAAAAMLQLPPPSKGYDLEEQHRILQLNYRHLQAELTRKSIACEGLLQQRETLLDQLGARLPQQQEAQRKLRTELAQQRQAADKQLKEMRQTLLAHTETLERLRHGSSALGSEERAQVEGAKALAVKSKIEAAVRMGALRGLQKRTASKLRVAQSALGELGVRYSATEAELVAERSRVSELERNLEAETAARTEWERNANVAMNRQTESEERCAALEVQLSETREREASSARAHAEAAEASATELAERTLRIESLEAAVADARQKVASAQAAASHSEEERQRAVREASNAASTCEARAQAEVDAQRAAQAELLSAHEEEVRQMRRKLEQQQVAHSAAQATAADELRSLQEDRDRQRKLAEQAAEQVRSMAERLAREQHARQESDALLQETRRAAPNSCNDARLHEAHDAASAARAEAAALRVQVEQLQAAKKAAANRASELEQQLRHSEERAARAAQQLHDANVGGDSEVQAAQMRLAQMRSRQVQLEAQAAEHEREAGRRCADLEAETSRLREQLRLQAEASARQIGELKQAAASARREAMAAAQRESGVAAASKPPPGVALHAISPFISPPTSQGPTSHNLSRNSPPAANSALFVPDLLESPLEPNGMQAMQPVLSPPGHSGAVADLLSPSLSQMRSLGSPPAAAENTFSDADELETLRSKLTLAQKRESVAVELRQLAESYKAKAERLGKMLEDERERAGAQSEVWKQQLKTLRARAREEKEHSRQLEERLRSFMQSEGRGSRDKWQTPSPRPAPLSGASTGHTTPTSGVKGALRQGMGKVLSSATEKVDSALDKVDGLVERLARNAKKGEYTPASTDGD